MIDLRRGHHHAAEAVGLGMCLGQFPGQVQKIGMGDDDIVCLGQAMQVLVVDAAFDGGTGDIAFEVDGHEFPQLVGSSSKEVVAALKPARHDKGIGRLGDIQH